MGRTKFRLSDMIPNAWFYKLRDMKKLQQQQLPSKRGGGRCGRSGAGESRVTPAPVPAIAVRPRTHLHSPRSSVAIKQQLLLSPNRPSYYYPSRTDPFSPPRKSRKSRSHKRRATSPVTDTQPRRRDMLIGYLEEDGDEMFKPIAADVKEHNIPASSPADENNQVSSLKDGDMPVLVPPPLMKLAPIVTKPARKEAAGDETELQDKHVDLIQKRSRGCSSPISEQSKPKSRTMAAAGAHRVKVKVKSPRVSNGKASPAHHRKGDDPLVGSFAVVKFSADPRGEFRQSMEEMIAETGINTAQELEALLAAYLTLNNSEYHDMIVEVFVQAWIDHH